VFCLAKVTGSYKFDSIERSSKKHTTTNILWRNLMHAATPLKNLYEPVTLARQNTLPEDGSLRTETCRSSMDFIKNF
jgi:hypothetical protein